LMKKREIVGANGDRAGEQCTPMRELPYRGPKKKTQQDKRRRIQTRGERKRHGQPPLMEKFGGMGGAPLCPKRH